MEINKLNQQILINVNGELLPREKATITVYESGYLMGDGIWEGIRLIDNKLTIIHIYYPTIPT